jgi:hypothetical protein
MKTGKELLNAVQAMLIEFANSNNISLRDEFKSVDQFKQFVIALTVKSLTDNGIETSKAFDIVFGDGSFEQLANDVWQTLNTAPTI